MNQDQKIAEISKVLGADTRVKIIRLLRQRSFCVGALSIRLGITSGAVSQHLRVLKSAGLGPARKEGLFRALQSQSTGIAKVESTNQHIIYYI